MKVCGRCGASNIAAARFCSECGHPLDAPPADRKSAPRIAARSLAAVLASGSGLGGRWERLAALTGRKADIVFVLDCTGSMQGEIDAIKEAIGEFAGSIESDGVRARVGLVAFRDRLIGEEHEALTFGGEVFTADAALFRREIAGLHADGGGDEPESSLDALMLALRQPFAPDASKVLVLVTDAPPHVPDKETRSTDEVIAAMRAVALDQFYLVTRVEAPWADLYLALLDGVRNRNGSLAFDLGTGDEFRERAQHFIRTLKALGKTISVATR